MSVTDHAAKAAGIVDNHGEWYHADRDEVPVLLARAQVHATLALRDTVAELLGQRHDPEPPAAVRRLTQAAEAVLMPRAHEIRIYGDPDLRELLRALAAIPDALRGGPLPTELAELAATLRAAAEEAGR